MKHFLTFLTVLLSLNLTFAQTYVSDTVSGHWTSDNSPYYVTGNLTVPANDTLFIESGVHVIFQGYYKLLVNGVLIANGSAQDSIFFTTSDTATGWNGIDFINSNVISKLNYCVLEYGKSDTGNYPEMHGGAVILLNSNAVFTNCVFRHNLAWGDENGMGGAVYAHGTGGSDSSLTKFVNCKFIDNHAYGEGGAIKFSGDDSTLVFGCQFIGNSCLYGGGAINFYLVSGTTIIKSLFARNYTVYSAGGAANTLGQGNKVYFINCTFSDNEAQHGDGGALNISYAQIYMTNSIVYNNPGMYSNDLHLDFDGYADINYSDLTMPDGATGSNNIDQDPMFVNPDSLDYHLSPGSPCIDAGTDVGLDYSGQAPDMGCFEFDSSGTGPTLIFDDLKIKIYPDPFSDFIVVDNGLNRNLMLQIFDTQGKLLKTAHVKSPFYNWNLSKLNSGTYFLKINSNNLHKTVKIIKY